MIEMRSMNRENKELNELKMYAVKRSKLLGLPVENENQVLPFIDSIFIQKYFDWQTFDGSNTKN